MITSTSNPRIRQLIALQEKAKKRREENCFLAEGIKMLREAPESWIREIYLTNEALYKLQKEEAETFQKINRTGYELLSDEVMKRASDTQTPQGVITVLDRPSYEPDELLADSEGTFLLLENLQDPGNLGTIVRTGEGAGVRGIIMTADTVDIFNPKTIRSTMGSVYRVPFIYVETLTEVVEKMKEKNIPVYAAHLKGQKNYYEFDYRKGCAFLIGNEGNGLKKETADLADDYLKIPMQGQVESLNAAIAASVLMYEAYRQRS
ncbi:MAG: TrmH family RNA methyltransferase [Lachnospiraceae bacterium]